MLLPLDKINRVPNLATVHWDCHEMIHNVTDYSYLSSKIWEKILNLEKIDNFIMESDVK
jgi:RNA-directed DNA polymerase